MTIQEHYNSISPNHINGECTADCRRVGCLEEKESFVCINGHTFDQPKRISLAYEFAESDDIDTCPVCGTATFEGRGAVALLLPRIKNMKTKPKYLWKSMQAGMKSAHGEVKWKVGKWFKEEKIDITKNL